MYIYVYILTTRLFGVVMVDISLAVDTIACAIRLYLSSIFIESIKYSSRSLMNWTKQASQVSTRQLVFEGEVFDLTFSKEFIH